MKNPIVKDFALILTFSTNDVYAACQDGTYNHFAEETDSNSIKQEKAMVTNHNSIIGTPTTYKHFARQVDGLVFFTHIYDDTPPHKDLTPKEDIEKFQNIKYAKPVVSREHQIKKWR